MVNIIILCYNIVGPLSCVWSVDRNIFMRGMTVLMEYSVE